MKYAAVLLFAVGAFAVPQDATVTTTSAPRAVASGLSPAVSCALACDAGDVNCQAACLGNARPNASQAIATNECAAKCDQGDGSTAESQAYARCVDACINSLFPSTQTANIPGAGAGPAGAASSAASAAASATNSALSTVSAGASAASGSGSSSGSGASPQSTGAADINSARIAGAGLAGLFAIFAL